MVGHNRIYNRATMSAAEQSADPKWKRGQSVLYMLGQKRLRAVVLSYNKNRGLRIRIDDWAAEYYVDPANVEAETA